MSKEIRAIIDIKSEYFNARKVLFKNLNTSNGLINFKYENGFLCISFIAIIILSFYKIKESVSLDINPPAIFIVISFIFFSFFLFFLFQHNFKCKFKILFYFFDEKLFIKNFSKFYPFIYESNKKITHKNPSLASIKYFNEYNDFFITQTKRELFNFFAEMDNNIIIYFNEIEQLASSQYLQDDFK